MLVPKWKSYFECVPIYVANPFNVTILPFYQIGTVLAKSGLNKNLFGREIRQIIISISSSLPDRHNAQPGAHVRGQGVAVAAREGEEDPAVQQGPRRPHQGRLGLHHLEGHSAAGRWSQSRNCIN